MALHEYTARRQLNSQQDLHTMGAMIYFAFPIMTALACSLFPDGINLGFLLIREGSSVFFVLWFHVQIEDLVDASIGALGG